MTLEVAIHDAECAPREPLAHGYRARRNQRAAQAFADLARMLGRRRSFHVERNGTNLSFVPEANVRIALGHLRMFCRKGLILVTHSEVDGRWRYAISEAGRALLRSEASSASA